MTNEAEALVYASKRALGTFIIFISQSGVEVMIPGS